MPCRCSVISPRRRLASIALSLSVLAMPSASRAVVDEGQKTADRQSLNLKTQQQQPTTPSPGPRDDQSRGNMQASNPDSAQAARESAKSIIEDALSYAHRASPVEYSLLPQVEAATLLWQFDQERALSILGGVCEKLRELKGKDPDKTINSKQRRLRYLVFYKIARLKPELVSGLALDKPKGTAPGEWTEEARAVMRIADEQIDGDPELAVRLALQAFSLGQVDWVVFLWKLSARDPRLAEQTAMKVISILGDSPLTPIYLLNFNRFPLRPECSAQLKDYYFQALASRLQRDIRPDLAMGELGSNVATAREAMRIARAYPRWQEEFAGIVFSLEELLNARSVVARQPSAIHISMPPDVTEGETKEIASEAPVIEKVREPRARDLRYQKLAAGASLKADLLLAEELMGKIEDNDIRRETSLKVYGPHVSQSIRDSDWARGREHALKIIDPLGRTLALVRIAQGMASSNKDKQAIKDLYTLAAKRLQKDTMTEDVARAFFILSKSLSSISPEESLEAVNWGIYVSNKVIKNGESFGDIKVSAEIAPWISVPGFLLHDEALDLTEIIGPIFEALAKRDASNARSVSSGFNHLGLYSLAQLGIARALLQKSDIKQKARAMTQTLH